MRRSLVLLSLPVAWVACFSSNDSHPADAGVAETEAPEAGQDAPAQPPIDATFDAPGEALADAPPDVAASSEAAAEAGAAPVSVSVIAAAGPEPGVPVVFTDVTGNVVASLATDASGLAAAPVPAGGSVTVLLGSPASPKLTTALGVQPGQTLVVLDWGSVSVPPAQITALPTSFLDASITQNIWRMGHQAASCTAAPCSATPFGPPQPSFGMGRFGTTVGAALPALVEAEDDFGVVYGFAYAKDLPLTRIDDAGLLDIALGNTWSTSMTSQTVNVIQPDAGGLNGTYYSEVADGVPTPVLTTPYTTHPGFAEFVQAEADFGNSNWPVVAARLPPPTADGTVDLDATGVATAPAFSTAAITVSASGQPTLSWTLAQGSLASATGLVALTSWTAPSPDGGTQHGTWTLVSPGTAQSSITAPLLPGGFGPLVGATASVDTMYAVIGQTGVPTYDHLLGMTSTFWVLQGCVSGPFVPPLPAAGTAIVSIFGNAMGC